MSGINAGGNAPAQRTSHSLPRQELNRILDSNPQNWTPLDPQKIKKRKVVYISKDELTAEQRANLSEVRFQYGMGFYQQILKERPASTNK